MFEATALNQRNHRIEFAMRALFLSMTLLLILPVLIILSVLVVKGMPMISWEFLTAEPTNGMTQGGIFPALVGTVAIVIVVAWSGGQLNGSAIESHPRVPWIRTRCSGSCSIEQVNVHEASPWSRMALNVMSTSVAGSSLAWAYTLTGSSPRSIRLTSTT